MRVTNLDTLFKWFFSACSVCVCVWIPETFFFRLVHIIFAGAHSSGYAVCTSTCMTVWVSKIKIICFLPHFLATKSIIAYGFHGFAKLGDQQFPRISICLFSDGGADVCYAILLLYGFWIIQKIS